MKRARGKKFILFILFYSQLCGSVGLASEYETIQKNLARGWNTWNTRNVLSHILLPQGLAINVNFKYSERDHEYFLSNGLFGEMERTGARIVPGVHAWDGSYSELYVTWQMNTISIQSAVDNGDFYLLVTPETLAEITPVVVIEAGLLWNQPGSVLIDKNVIKAVFTDTLIQLFSSRDPIPDPNIQLTCPYFSIPLEQPTGFCTGKRRTLEEISSVISRQKQIQELSTGAYGGHADLFSKLRSMAGWNTVYYPDTKRVLTTVDRARDKEAGGWEIQGLYSLFTSYLTVMDSSKLVYANILEPLERVTSRGFLPVEMRANGYVTGDRSALPVGSMVVWDIYQLRGEKWLLQVVFDKLLAWNRWWDIYRSFDGLLCFGSNSFENTWEDSARGNQLGAFNESGKVSIYKNIPFNEKTRLLEAWDVGLTSLYIKDCLSLANIAKVLEKKGEEKELRDRAKVYLKNLERLADTATGLYLNARTDKDETLQTITPSLFYPLIAGGPSADNAKKMVESYLTKPDILWGEWALASISRSDSLFAKDAPDRGAVWPYMNFLVYLGLKNYNLTDTQKQLAQISEKIFITNCSENTGGFAHYNPVTGAGIEGAGSSTCFSGSALLGMMILMEDGFYFNKE